MSTVQFRFIEPLDVLFLRGNKLFGDPGSYGESLIPPWPSVAAGAIRSRMLADAKVDLTDFAKGNIDLPGLGTPAKPGSFTISAFHLAQRCTSGVEMLVAPPADLVISNSTDSSALTIRTLAPTALKPNTGVLSSAPLPLLPVLAEQERSKPASGYWLKQSGWKKYLAGQVPSSDDLVHSSELWKIDPRVGVGLASDTRRAADGKLFTMQAVAMRTDVGFLVGVSGAEPPDNGMLRFGGDGRAATISATTFDLPLPDYAAIVAARRCRIVLTSPGLFPEGWKLPGLTADNNVCIGGIRGRVVCAAVPRAEVISGWDLSKNQPKPAQRVAPTGSVYWLDQLDATPEALRKLAKNGLWSQPDDNAARRAEGFNRVSVAAWQ